MKDLRLQQQLKRSRIRNEEEAIKFASGELKDKKIRSNRSWVEGRSGEEQKGFYQSGVAVEEDEDYEEDNKKNVWNEGGVDVEEIDKELMQVDHEHELAIDRRLEDADEFQTDHEFDDDDEGGAEDIENEGLAHLLLPSSIVHLYFG